MVDGDKNLVVIDEDIYVASVAEVFVLPVVIQTKDLDVAEVLQGDSISIVPSVFSHVDVQNNNNTPILDSSIPLVVGSVVENRTPTSSEALVLDNAEIDRLQFNVIQLGSSNEGQKIWLQTDPTKDVNKLTFKGRLVLNTRNFGENRFQGVIEGNGLDVQGSGHTTYLDGADLWQDGDVLIDDSLVITGYDSMESVIEVTQGQSISICGNIIVKSGHTLQLLASTLNFAPYGSNDSASIVLEEGATLILGADKIVGLTSAIKLVAAEGAMVVLRGGPSSVEDLENGAKPMYPNFVPEPFAPQAADLEALLAWLATDADGNGEQDATINSLVMGDASADTYILTPYAWNEVTVGNIKLEGQEVHLGTSGISAWTLNNDAYSVFQASTGNLNLHVGLNCLDGSSIIDPTSDLSLVANQGGILMDAGVSVFSEGALTVTAKRGIVLADLTSETQVDLYSESGSVLAASAVLPDAGSHVTAPAVSMHGYGALVGSADVSRVLLVDSDMLTVSAPHGLVSQKVIDFATIDYELIDGDTTYLQLHALSLIDENPVGNVFIWGDCVQGSVLHASYYFANLKNIDFISYQWMVDGVLVAGATGGTYLLDKYDIGRAVSVAVNYIDSRGVVNTISSSQTIPVLNSVGVLSPNTYIAFTHETPSIFIEKDMVAKVNDIAGGQTVVIATGAKLDLDGALGSNLIIFEGVAFSDLTVDRTGQEIHLTQKVSHQTIASIPVTTASQTLRFTDGDQMLVLTDKPRLNGVEIYSDTVSPILLGISLYENTLSLHYDEELDSVHLPSLTSLNISEWDGVQWHDSAFTVDKVVGKDLRIQLPTVVSVQTRELQVSYTDSIEQNDGGAIQDINGNDAATFSGIFAKKWHVCNSLPDGKSIQKIDDHISGKTVLALEDSAFRAFENDHNLTDKIWMLGSDSFQDEDDFLIFNPYNGLLAYDADGSGAGVPVTFAELLGVSVLSVADLVVI